MSTKTENIGWNPSYIISTLLMQLQSFLSDPDLSENSMPKPHQIKELMDSMNNYQRIFKINEENGEIIKIYFKVKEISNQTENLIFYDKNKLIKENLTCFITKLNIFDDPYIILGYPIVKKGSNIIYPIPEILSYEGYLIQTTCDYYQEDFYSFEYHLRKLKSANNE